MRIDRPRVPRAHTFASDLTLNPAGGQFRLRKRGYALTVASIIALLGGAAATAGGYAWVTSYGPSGPGYDAFRFGPAPDGAKVLFVGGLAIGALGLIGLVSDLALGHSWEIHPEAEPREQGREGG